MESHIEREGQNRVADLIRLSRRLISRATAFTNPYKGGTDEKEAEKR